MSGSFFLLNKKIQEAIHRNGWEELRPIQSESIRAVYESQKHLLIRARTAGGKTEAAFLPILSRALDSGQKRLHTLYISPLKTLINDQFRRLERLCQETDITVHRWHGDISATLKQQIRKNPSGILLITPESMESLYINHQADLSIIFKDLEYIVIDELHAFLSGERGIHLRSLLLRCERYCKKKPRLVGLSATVGEPRVAKIWISGSNEDEVLLIDGKDDGRSLRLQLRSYEAEDSETEDEKGEGFSPSAADVELSTNLYECFSGKNSLIFANRKRDVELYAHLTQKISERKGRNCRFVVHHGSLSKDIREETERLLQSSQDVCAFCSSTLELGIDVGSISEVGQIGAPWSVSSCVQRIGRSGRREGDIPTMRMYVVQSTVRAGSSLLQRIYPEFLRAVGILKLVIEQWIESESNRDLHLSTLVHQILSVIREHGGVKASVLFDILVVSGAFRRIDRALFVACLRDLGKCDLVEQGPDGFLILGMNGEKLTRRFDFYAAFLTQREINVLCDGRLIGTISEEEAPPEGTLLLLGGKRWVVLRLENTELHVKPASSGRVPRFSFNAMTDTDIRIHQEMCNVLREDVIPTFLHKSCQSILANARSTAQSSDICGKHLIEMDGGTYIFTWSGSKVNRTLCAMLRLRGLDATEPESFVIFCNKCSVDSVAGILRQFLSMREEEFDILELAAALPIRRSEKFERYLSTELQLLSFAVRSMTISDTLKALRSLVSNF